MIPWREVLGGLAVVGAILLFMTAVISVAAWGAHKAIRYADVLDDAEQDANEPGTASTATPGSEPNGRTLT